jgi:hypothetical protein
MKASFTESQQTKDMEPLVPPSTWHPQWNSRPIPLFNDRARLLVTSSRDATMNKPGKLDAFAENAEQTARRGEIIQEEVDRVDNSGAARKQGGAMQAGARQYPDSFPKQHLKKPGLEAELDPAPMYQGRH